MYVGIFSMRYAKALLAYANGEGTAATVYAEAKQLSDRFMQVPGLRRALDNPVLPTQEKVKLVCKAADCRADGTLARFTELVLAHRREKFLQFMVVSFMDLYRRQENISIGKITTLCPVSDEVVGRIRALVEEQTHGTAEFQAKVDPKLEGGFIFEIGTYRLDASVADQMKRVKRQFIDKNKRIV